MVFGGVDDKNQEILFEDDPSKNILVDLPLRCPPFCDEDSPLNK